MRGAFRKKAKPQVINAMWDTEKLHQMTLQQKRHSLRRPIRPVDNTIALQGNQSQVLAKDRIKEGPADYFKVYCR